MRAGDQAALVLMVALSAMAAVASSTGEQCRCSDSSTACWPTDEEWDAFNATVAGRLIAPKPTGSPCHDPHFNATLCQYIRENYFDSYLRADNAGSMQNENWEDDGHETCSMNAPQSAACHQGQVPVLSVQVEAIQDIQTAVKFAADHNLRLVVKTSGHDYLGRSTAAGSFLIWMHKLKNITIHESSFVPSGGCGQYDASTPAVTVAGGVGWGEVYDALKPTGFITVGGMALTVGATGGYVQGGGHGVLGPSLGLATDNVLQIELVTADGKLRTANACQEPELFFALRGGGGGTFGVVTSVTYKLHKSPRDIAGIFLVVNPPNGTSWTPETQEEVLTVWSRGTVALDAALWGGYWTFNAQTFSAYFLVPSTEAAANSTLNPVVEGLSQIDNVTAVVYSFNSSTFQDWHRTVYGISNSKTYTDYTGNRPLLGSRIIPLSALEDPRSLARNILAAMAVCGDCGVLGHMVIGPGVRTADPYGQTAVTPAWRQGIWHLATSATWKWNATEAEKREARIEMKTFVESLQTAYPDSGAYVNEASIDEPEWQRSFWGRSNYAQLIATKLRIDPLGLFVCRQCVGSELWDENGNCRQVL